VICIVIVAGLLLPILGCEPHGDTEAKNMGGWTRVGSVSAEGGGCGVYWTTNPENGDRIYILVGGYKGGIFVIPKK